MNYKHLTTDERYHIDELLREGHSQTTIAKRLGRSRSTISRELRRNQGERGWRPRQSSEKSRKRLSERGRLNVRRVSDEAWNDARKHLVEEQWSPEQIAGRAKLEGLARISHETIYQRVLEDKQQGGELYLNLRCKKKRKKRYSSGKSGRGMIPNRVDISERPEIVEGRSRIGDWEGDTIIGAHNGGAVIASMVERVSRLTRLAKSKNKTTVEVVGSINKKMSDISKLVYTLTLDNGREFSHHEELANCLDTAVFFARPYHSWERGLNENTNGLVRQYFPKKTSFDDITEEMLEEVSWKLNNRPRKSLGYQTPLEVFSKECERLGIPLQV